MTRIVLDEKAAATPLGELLELATDDVLEFCDPDGQVIGTLLLNGHAARDEEYAQLIADAEQNIDELLRIANTPREKCITSEEHLARLRALSAE